MICVECGSSSGDFNNLDDICDDCLSDLNDIEASYFTQPTMYWDERPDYGDSDSPDLSSRSSSSEDYDDFDVYIPFE